MSDEVLFPDTDDTELLQLVIDQINKDFGISGIYFEVSPLISLQQIVEIIFTDIVKLHNQKPGILMKIIYRVDLSEKQFKKVQKIKGDYCLNLSKAIVLREFQKIILRRKIKT